MKNHIPIIRAVGDIIAAIVARELGLRDTQIFGKTRGDSQTVLARQITIYLLHVLFRCSPSQLAAAVYRDRSTIRHAFRVVEDYRDDSVFDDRITLLETQIAFLAESDVIAGISHG